MTNIQKLKLFEEMLELDEGALNEGTLLDSIDVWDSMAAISLIVLMDEKFNKPLKASQIKSFNTVKDVIDFME